MRARSVFGSYALNGYGPGLGTVDPPRLVPPGWTETGRWTTTADDTDAASTYAHGTATALYAPPAGTVVVEILKSGLGRRIYIEPSGAVRRSWEIQRVPLEAVATGGGHIDVDPSTLIHHQGTLKSAVGWWWLLPAGAAAWYVASGRPKRPRNRRRNPGRATFHETLAGAFLLGLATDVLANIITNPTIAANAAAGPPSPAIRTGT